MKGIAHFITGVAAASCFPFSVRAAEEGNPLYFILGGAFGILPDTIDFKFYRFFYRHDLYIEPTSRDLDPQTIADQLAGAFDRAAENGECRVKLSTIRMGADLWQQYKIKFDAEAGEVVVKLGPVVNTGQVPVPNSTSQNRPAGRAKLKHPVVQTYDAVTTVDIFDGPSFLFAKNEEGRIEAHFLPWHRNWSHSYTVGVSAGLVIWLLWGLMAWLGQQSMSGFIHGWKPLVIIALGYAGHLVEDQMGFMGSNLLYPFTKKRMKGMHVMRSGDSLPNFLAVWICCVIIFWNLYRFADDPTYSLSLLQVTVMGGLMPLAVFGVLFALVNRGRKKEKREIDTSKEWGDPSIG